jgi:uncharacterized protein (DUF736 family)
MANIGTLVQKGERNGLPILRGNIVSMILETPIAIDPTGEVARNGAPIFSVRLKTPSGRTFEGGHAFMNEIKTGDNAGAAMFTIKIGRQPGIPEALELAAWPVDGDDDAWFLAMGSSAPAGRPASSGGNGWEPPEDTSDEIPF